MGFLEPFSTMARLYPSINDTSKNVLWFKVANNFYDWAVANGITGLTPPGFGEPYPSLQKKVVYYTAILVDTP